MSPSDAQPALAAGALRERDFWGHRLPPVEEVLAEVRAGPDPNTKAMLDAVEPLAGRRVLDFACGTGVTTAWLALRGARVTGLDITPEAVDAARQVATNLGLEADFVTAPLEEYEAHRPFQAIVGRYALHHVDVASTAPLLGRMLASDGTAAFVETMAANPLLRLARKHLTGRFGVPRYGTIDEHPLTDVDVAQLERHLGGYTDKTAQADFLRIFDRQLLHYRWPGISRLLATADQWLFAEKAHRWSYHQVLSFSRSGTEEFI